MTIKELKNKIDDFLTAYPDKAGKPVEIILSDSSIGFSKGSEVIAFGEGIDWDSGRIFIIPKDQLITMDYFKRKKKG